MVHSDLKNTIDLIKNINGLQLNFNNQNLTFKHFTRNSKFITFTNHSGIDVNLSIDELNNKYKKKYTIDSENSIDTSIFNSNKNKNKNLKEGNQFNDISSTSNSFMSKLNNNLSNSNKNSEEYNFKKLKGGNQFSDMSATSNSFMSKLNNNSDDSLTSNSLNLPSATSNSFMSKINDNIVDSVTSNTFVGGNINETNLISLDETSIFEDSISQKGGYNEDVNTIISIDLDNLKINRTDKDTVNYSSNSTLNSLSEINKNNEFSDSKILNKFLKQNGGGKNLVNSGFKTYNINSSSTSSVCE